MNFWFAIHKAMLGAVKLCCCDVFSLRISDWTLQLNGVNLHSRGVLVLKIASFEGSGSLGLLFFGVASDSSDIFLGGLRRRWVSAETPIINIVFGTVCPPTWLLAQHLRA